MDWRWNWEYWYSSYDHFGRSNTIAHRGQATVTSEFVQKDVKLHWAVCEDAELLEADATDWNRRIDNNLRCIARDDWKLAMWATGTTGTKAELGCPSETIQKNLHEQVNVWKIGKPSLCFATDDNIPSKGTTSLEWH